MPESSQNSNITVGLKTKIQKELHGVNNID
jgi:hypothetical protein